MKKYILSLFIVSMTTFSALKANDFPTQARSNLFLHVWALTIKWDFMAKCSCAIDEIAKRISYEEYAQAEAIARLWKEQVQEKRHLKA